MGRSGQIASRAGPGTPRPKEGHTDDERARTAAEVLEGEPDKDAIETTDSVATAGRRLITEDWAATIVGLVLLALVLVGVIGRGMVP